MKIQVKETFSLVEMNHWGEQRTEKTNATLYKRHKLSEEDIHGRDIQKLVCVLHVIIVNALFVIVVEGHLIRK